MSPRRGGRRGGVWRSDEWAREWFPPSRPLPTEEGIQARSRRGAFAETWWGRLWIEVLEGFGLGARLGRGKRYARQGQVLSIDVEDGRVLASVQGSRKKPYRVEVGLAPVPPDVWDAVLERLGQEAAFGARLLAGELSPEAEDAFAQAGAPLLPREMEDVETDCSCPDWSNPCKHVAAVHYLIAEELDRDPFLLFALRGIERDALIGRLEEGMEARRAEEATGEVPAGAERRPDAETAADSTSTQFWTGAPAERDDSGPAEIHVPDPAAPLLRRLGPVPFWRGRRPLIDDVEAVYRSASEVALDLLAVESPAPEQEE